MYIAPHIDVGDIYFSFYWQALLQLPNLKMLYLHGNNIGRLAEVDKLARLPSLRLLTLHGNPIEVRPRAVGALGRCRSLASTFPSLPPPRPQLSPGYKHHVLSELPQLQTLDFSRVTKSDRATASTWHHMIAPKVKKAKKKED